MLGELDRDLIEHVLRSQMLGRIGCHAEGQTYVVPITYAYDGESVYAHSVEGMKLAMMRKSPHVCFEVEDVHGMAAWRSVVAWGDYEELEGGDADNGMRILLNRLLPVVASDTVLPTHGAPHTMGSERRRRAVVYRIHLTEKTGRFEKR